MQIRFPRRIRLGFRPVYGLTIRQLVYLAAFGIVGGLMILAGPFQGASILVRAVIGVIIMVAGLSLAFLRIAGLSIDEWLPIGVRYLIRPRRRVWRKRDIAHPVFKTPQTQPTSETATSKLRSNFMPNSEIEPVVRSNQRAVLKTGIIVIDAFVLIALGAVTIYLREGGFAEVQNTLAQLMR